MTARIELTAFGAGGLVAHDVEMKPREPRVYGGFESSMLVDGNVLLQAQANDILELAETRY